MFGIIRTTSKNTHGPAQRGRAIHPQPPKALSPFAQSRRRARGPTMSSDTAMSAAPPGAGTVRTLNMTSL